MANHQKFTAALLTGALLAAQTAPALAAEDLSGHWASEALSIWQEHGIIRGDDLGNINPDKPITRAEMAVILDRVMAYQVKNENGYTDLDHSWYTDAILGASAAGIISGYEDGSVKPGANMTRQETAVIFARILALDTEQAPTASYKDQEEIGDWAADAVNAMTAKGYLNGHDGLFRPADFITRAEVVTILNNIFASFIDEAGAYSEDVDGSVVINAGDVVLRDMDISGDLIIAEGVGDGHVELDGVTVDGQVIVRGGGENSIVVKGTSNLSDVALARFSGQLRLSVEGDAVVSDVAVTEKANAVQIEGSVDTVTVEASGAEVEITGSVENVAVTEAADNTVLTIAEGAEVGTISAHAGSASIDVSGSVTALEVHEGAEGAAVSVEETAQVESITTAAADTVLTVSGTVSQITATQSASGTVVKAETGAEIASVVTAGANTTIQGEGTVSRVEAAEGATGTTVTTEGTQVENNSSESVTTGGGSIDAGSSGSSSSGGPSDGGDGDGDDGDDGEDGSSDQTVTLPFSGDWTEETFTIQNKQTAIIDSDYVIPAGKRLIVADGGTLTVRGTLTAESGETRGELRVAQGGTLTVEAEGRLEGAIVKEVGTAFAQADVDSLFNRYAVTGAAALSGEVSLSGGVFLEVEEGGALTIGDGASLTIQGGSGLHIMTGGQVINEALLSVEEGQLTVDTGAQLSGTSEAELRFGAEGSVTGEGAAALGFTGEAADKTFTWKEDHSELGGQWVVSAPEGTTVEELTATAQNAQDYVYEDYEYAGGFDLQVEDAFVTIQASYTQMQFLQGDAMKDMARYLGALYRVEDSAVKSITFDGVVYTWAENPTLAGSNWVKDASAAAEDGNTLVSAIVDYYQEHMVTSLTLTLKGEGDAEVSLIFSFEVTGAGAMESR